MELPPNCDPSPTFEGRYTSRLPARSTGENTGGYSDAATQRAAYTYEHIVRTYMLRHVRRRDDLLRRQLRRPQERGASLALDARKRIN
ncbi:hypothetical protein HPB50_002545 [Hyalomma asiaticum]|uniref:Uncharacterized protein n=1 Tax=Hyalomma asiaticum TaxID=266040 RepID=A0ACB7SSH6_HYAAI|nr:hypothetical protein HPB50_002545 [Hyalomma asiaticum]